MMVRLCPFHLPITSEEWESLRENFADLPKPRVFTNGCFDLLHDGHIYTLEHARAAGRSLTVAINSDAGVRELKGNDRPFQHNRETLLRAIRFVDLVIMYHAPNPVELLCLLKPEILVKGGSSWADGAPVPGQLEMEEWGGKTLFTPLLAGESTTNIVKRIRGNAAFK